MTIKNEETMKKSISQNELAKIQERVGQISTNLCRFQNDRRRRGNLDDGDEF